LVDEMRQVMSCEIQERQPRRVGLECSKSEEKKRRLEKLTVLSGRLNVVKGLKQTNQIVLEEVVLEEVKWLIVNPSQNPFGQTPQYSLISTASNYRKS
jgi:hypothetical protein